MYDTFVVCCSSYHDSILKESVPLSHRMLTLFWSFMSTQAPSIDENHRDDSIERQCPIEPLVNCIDEHINNEELQWIPEILDCLNQTSLQLSKVCVKLPNTSWIHGKKTPINQ